MESQHLTNYTSNTAIKSMWTCPRKRYLNFFYGGLGIVPTTRSIPLSTGTCIHKGIEHMARWLKRKGNTLQENIRELAEDVIEEAVQIGVQAYLDLLKGKGFHGKECQTTEAQEYTKGEQLAITEALIRAWGLRELPNLHCRFQIFEVEKEVAMEILPELELESRCDILLRERGAKDIYCYSLKSIKDFSNWTARGYRDDLQGLTEMRAAEHYLIGRNNLHKLGIDYIKTNLKGEIAEQMIKLLSTKLVANSPMGVKFCFLIKGKKEEIKIYGEGTGNYETASSLIRGYRKFDTQGTLYSHSWFFPNPNNQSGKGALGKGWEKFNIWLGEDSRVKDIKSWLAMLDSRVKDHSSDEWIFEMQPECGDVISKYVVTPPEIFRDDSEINNQFEQIKIQEEKVFKLVKQTDLTILQPNEWPMNRQACHYPSECEYIPICHGRECYTDKPVPWEVREDPIKSGWYERRTPHHEREKAANE